MELVVVNGASNISKSVIKSLIKGGQYNKVRLSTSSHTTNMSMHFNVNSTARELQLTSVLQPMVRPSTLRLKEPRRLYTSHTIIHH